LGKDVSEGGNGIGIVLEIIDDGVGIERIHQAA
jgi:hypothetical protein